MLAHREHLQAELVSQHGVAEDIGHPVHRPVQLAGVLITLQVAQRQDAQVHHDCVLLRPTFTSQSYSRMRISEPRTY